MQERIDNYYERISKNLKILRLKQKLSQEEFAEVIGCSREYVSRLENLKEKISLSMLLKISVLFNVEPFYFFC